MVEPELLAKIANDPDYRQSLMELLLGTPGKKIEPVKVSDSCVSFMSSAGAINYADVPGSACLNDDQFMMTAEEIESVVNTAKSLETTSPLSTSTGKNSSTNLSSNYTTQASSNVSNETLERAFDSSSSASSTRAKKSSYTEQVFSPDIAEYCENHANEMLLSPEEYNHQMTHVVLPKERQVFESLIANADAVMADVIAGIDTGISQHVAMLKPPFFNFREQFLSAETSIEDFQMVSSIINVLKTAATKDKEVVYEDFSALTIRRRWGQFLQLCWKLMFPNVFTKSHPGHIRRIVPNNLPDTGIKFPERVFLSCLHVHFPMIIIKHFFNNKKVLNNPANCKESLQLLTMQDISSYLSRQFANKQYQENLNSEQKESFRQKRRKIIEDKRPKSSKIQDPEEELDQLDRALESILETELRNQSDEDIFQPDKKYLFEDINSGEKDILRSSYEKTNKFSKQQAKGPSASTKK